MLESNKDKVKPGKTVLNDKYRIAKEIADIPSGTVFMARNREDSSFVHVRIYYDYLIDDDSKFQGMQDEFERYKQGHTAGLEKPIEIFMTEIADIRGIVPVAVFEQPSGKSVRDAMAADVDRCLEPEMAIHVIAKLAAAIEVLRKIEILLCFPRVDDIFIAKDNKVTVCNAPIFSFEQLEFDEESYQVFMGAPELYEDGEITPAAQSYALGCFFHMIVESGYPFLGDDQREKHLKEDCPGLNGISAKINKVMLSCLAKVPKKRPKVKRLASVFKGATSIKVGKKSKKGKKGKKGKGEKKKSKILPLLLLIVLGAGGYFGYEEFLKPKKKKKKVVAQVDEPVKQPEPEVEKEPEKKVIKKVAIKTKPQPIKGMALYVKPSFIMGSSAAYEDANKEHEVRLSTFYLDLTEVTNQDYLIYVEETGVKPPLNTRKKFNLWKDGEVSDDIKRQPVINVNWDMAAAYCKWRDARLPTEAEWEFAARGSDGRAYPWGDDEANQELAQFDGEWQGEKTLYEVDYFKEGRTPEGVYNLLGGVKEWVSDWYSDSYYTEKAVSDPQGPDSGTNRVVRGGSWEEGAEFSFSRDALPPKSQLEGVGFRCAKSYVKPPTKYKWVDEDGNEVDPPEEESAGEVSAVEDVKQPEPEAQPAQEEAPQEDSDSMDEEESFEEDGDDWEE